MFEDLAAPGNTLADLVLDPDVDRPLRQDRAGIVHRGDHAVALFAGLPLRSWARYPARDMRHGSIPAAARSGPDFDAAGPRPAHDCGIIIDDTGGGNETTVARTARPPDRAQLWIGPTGNSTFDRDLPRVEPDFAIFVWCK